MTADQATTVVQLVTGTIEQEGAETGSYAYEYNFGAKNETVTFYDGLNFA